MRKKKKMSHELDFTKGVAAIAYTGDTPWHGYGERLIPGDPLEVWLEKAGMDYTVLESPIYHNRWITNENKDSPTTDWRAAALNPLAFKQIPGKKILTRSDTDDILSVVTDRYKLVQPREVMEFFRDLIEDQGFEMHTAGVLKDGNRVWALAKTGKEFAVKGQDRIAGYLMLATSYDGKFSTTAQFTSIRVVCNNTLSWSLNMAEDQRAGVVKIPHTTEFNAAAVKEELGLLGQLNEEGWSNFQDNVIKLSEYKVSKREAVEFFLELLDVDEEAEGRQLQSTKKLLAFYESGPGAKFISSHNTTWGLVNAVSFFTDHARRGRTDRRFDSASFGSGAQLKAKAFSQALELVDAA
jgi:phage/plasmid-like protein (TIGR03299 family)